MDAPDAILAEIVFPDQTNHYGTLFGGEALQMMDKAAFIAASRLSRTAVVTASMDKTDFRQPVRHGELAEVLAKVVSRGRTSMVVTTELFSENLLTGERRLCTVSRFVMVAVDGSGRPTGFEATHELPASQ
ncbi:MAG TPA: acyl-CoA thioesterase [Candidatus Tumulicola sp.]|jgi:acyl-CoA hydrolase